MINHMIQVALGGAAGAVSRYLVGQGMLRLIGPGFPWATLTVNVLGSFTMGALISWFALRGGGWFAPLLTVGFLGGFTTFSSFSLDALVLYERGQAGVALIYVSGTVVACLAAVFAGAVLMREVLA